MKIIVVILIFGFFTDDAFSADTVTCESLQEKAEYSCEISICAEMQAEGYECFKDGDFYEGLQICAYEEFQDFLEDHNKKNPSQRLTCED